MFVIEFRSIGKNLRISSSDWSLSRSSCVQEEPIWNSSKTSEVSITFTYSTELVCDVGQHVFNLRICLPVLFLNFKLSVFVPLPQNSCHLGSRSDGSRYRPGDCGQRCAHNPEGHHCGRTIQGRAAGLQRVSSKLSNLLYRFYVKLCSIRLFWKINCVLM